MFGFSGSRLCLNGNPVFGGPPPTVDIEEIVLSNSLFNPICIETTVGDVLVEMRDQDWILRVHSSLNSGIIKQAFSLGPKKSPKVFLSELVRGSCWGQIFRDHVDHVTVYRTPLGLVVKDVPPDAEELCQIPLKLQFRPIAVSGGVVTFDRFGRITSKIHTDNRRISGYQIIRTGTGLKTCRLAIKELERLQEHGFNLNFYNSFYGDQVWFELNSIVPYRLEKDCFRNMNTELIEDLPDGTLVNLRFDSQYESVLLVLGERTAVICSIIHSIIEQVDEQDVFDEDSLSNEITSIWQLSQNGSEESLFDYLGRAMRNRRPFSTILGTHI
jgi:hypothetical protein